MPLKDAEKRREYQREYIRKWYEKNKKKHIAYVRKSDEKIKLWLKQYKESLSCEECGENHPACLDFHHIDPKEKKFSIGRMNDYLSMNMLKKEIAKCRILCANCHRKAHWREKNEKSITKEKESDSTNSQDS